MEAVSLKINKPEDLRQRNQYTFKIIILNAATAWIILVALDRTEEHLNAIIL
jgi:hypothetical protein